MRWHATLFAETGDPRRALTAPR